MRRPSPPSPSSGYAGRRPRNGSARRRALWLQDILPAGATATGVLEEGSLIQLARRVEQAAYRSAAHIVVISESFEKDLRRKSVPDRKTPRIYSSATRGILEQPRPEDAGDGVTLLTMGNVEHTQNLVELTHAFEASGELAELGARFVMAGDGVAWDDVRAAITTDGCASPGCSTSTSSSASSNGRR